MSSLMATSLKVEKIPPIIWQVMKKVNDKGEDIFLVGGVIRNLVLGRDLGGNFDLTTSARPEKIQSLFPESFYTNPFGMVGVPIWEKGKGKYTLEKQEGKPVWVVEITTYRSEFGYSDKRRPDKVIWGENLEKDLKRRDFTINALAWGWFKNKVPSKLDPLSLRESLTFIDLFSGIKDIQKKIIRAIGDPDKRFSEDALRLLRAVRFATQLGFKIEENTRKAIKAKSQLLRHISAERIRDEVFKILSSERPDYGFRLLDELELLPFVLPELLKTKKVILSKHHKYDLWEHSLLSMRYCPDTDPITRLAALIHDLGKADTWAIICASCEKSFPVDWQKPEFKCPYCGYESNPRQGGIFYNHEVVSSRLAKKITERWHLDKRSADKLFRLVRWHQFTVDENLSDKALRRFIRRVGKGNIPAMLALRVGDRLGSGVKQAVSWRMEKFIRRLTEVQRQPFKVTDLKVSGHDVMEILNLPPSPDVGKILEEIFKKVVNHQLPNERPALLAFLRQEAKAKEKE